MLTNISEKNDGHFLQEINGNSDLIIDDLSEASNRNDLNEESSTRKELAPVVSSSNEAIKAQIKRRKEEQLKIENLLQKPSTMYSEPVSSPSEKFGPNQRSLRIGDSLLSIPRVLSSASQFPSVTLVTINNDFKPNSLASLRKSTRKSEFDENSLLGISLNDLDQLDIDPLKWEERSPACCENFKNNKKPSRKESVSTGLFGASWDNASEYFLQYWVPSSLKRMIHHPLSTTTSASSSSSSSSVSVTEHVRQRKSENSLEIESKGLMNKLGENNCFLNVVIQSLWHLTSFRTRFRDYQQQQHYHLSHLEEEQCSLCSLKIIFTQYEFSESPNLPPDALRRSLSILYSSRHKFQLGQLDDAAEVHDALMNSLHNALVGVSPLEMPQNEVSCNPECFVHKIFGMNMIEYINCECGESSSFCFKQFIYYVSAEALRRYGTNYTNNDIRNDRTVTFSQLIHAINQDDRRQCKNIQCTKSNPVCYTLANVPEVITIGIVWNMESPSIGFISDILDWIDEEICLEEIFDGFLEKKRYSLCGLICYYGKHYNAHFKNRNNNEWHVFDDTTVKLVGKQWDSVVTRCRNGRFQPFLIWYEQIN